MSVGFGRLFFYKTFYALAFAGIVVATPVCDIFFCSLTLGCGFADSASKPEYFEMSRYNKRVGTLNRCYVLNAFHVFSHSGVFCCFSLVPLGARFVCRWGLDSFSGVLC